MITAARLTEYLIIEQLSVSANTFGEQVKTYSVIYKGYFSIMNDAGNRSFNEGSNYSSIVTFYGRYIPNLMKKGIRVKYNDEYYTIEEITNVQRNRATIIRCVNTK
jgi:head-tail adaptor